VCLLAGPGPAASAEDTATTAVVRRLNGVLLDTLKQAEALGYAGRFKLLAPAVGEAFDVDFMAEKSLGAHWKTLTDADQQRWLDVFREFTVANYAGNLDRFTGQSFELLGEEAGASETIVVLSRLIIPSGENVDLNYRLHQTTAGWRIADVYLKGTVSELALRRSDFTSALERGDFGALVTSLRGKIADLAAGRGRRQGA
jgi:phospholipid transport system substrate-binding protein